MAVTDSTTNLPSPELTLHPIVPEPVSPAPSEPDLTPDHIRAVAVITAQTGTPALAAIARYYLDTHPVAVPPSPDTGGLSAQEERVVQLIALGYSNKEIAAKMCLSVKTVETYKTRAMEKLGVKTRVALVQYAVRRGWLNPEPPESA